MQLPTEWDPRDAMADGEPGRALAPEELFGVRQQTGRFHDRQSNVRHKKSQPSSTLPALLVGLIVLRFPPASNSHSERSWCCRLFDLFSYPNYSAGVTTRSTCNLYVQTLGWKRLRKVRSNIPKG